MVASLSRTRMLVQDMVREARAATNDRLQAAEGDKHEGRGYLQRWPRPLVRLVKNGL